MAEAYEEVTLSTGTVVRVMPIPTMLTMDVMQKVPEFQYPPDPEMVEVKTKVGTEKRAARPGDEMYDAWEEKYDDVSAVRLAFLNQFPWQEGIVSWKLAGQKQFTSEPPKDWKINERWEKLYGIGLGGPPLIDAHRMAYLKYVIAGATADYNLIQGIVNRGMIVMAEEVDDTVKSFPD